jgi:ribosome-associated translation inhibitor RaiA
MIEVRYDDSIDEVTEKLSNAISKSKEKIKFYRNGK